MALDKTQEPVQSHLEHLGLHNGGRLPLRGLTASLINREELVISVFNHSLTTTSSK